MLPSKNDYQFKWLNLIESIDFILNLSVISDVHQSRDSNLFSPYKAVLRTLKFILIAYKKHWLLETNTISTFLLFNMKYIIDGGCLFEDW